MTEMILENWKMLLLCLGVAAFSLWMYSKWLKLKAWWRMRRIRHLGSDGESQARDALESLGFVEIETSNHSKHHWSVGGEEVSFALKPDILASREGEKWLIEVKNGYESSYQNRLTRRQLLEYQYQYPEYRVALFDVPRNELFEVNF